MSNDTYNIPIPDGQTHRRIERQTNTNKKSSIHIHIVVLQRPDYIDDSERRKLPDLISGKLQYIYRTQGI